MSEFLTKAQESFLIYRLLIGKMLLTVAVTFALGWQALFAQTKLSTLDNDERFYSAMVLLALVGDKLIAFFDKTVSQLSKGKLPVDENGGTSQWTKQTDKTNEKTPPLSNS